MASRADLQATQPFYDAVKVALTDANVDLATAGFQLACGPPTAVGASEGVISLWLTDRSGEKVDRPSATLVTLSEGRSQVTIVKETGSWIFDERDPDLSDPKVLYDQMTAVAELLVADLPTVPAL